MSYPKRSDYALAPIALAALLSFSFSAEFVMAAPQPGLCSGALTKSEHGFVIDEKPEHMCIFSGDDLKKILAVCGVGHQCEVEGMLDDCKEDGECSEIRNVVSVRDVTLAKQQEQPPHPDVPP